MDEIRDVQDKREGGEQRKKQYLRKKEQEMRKKGRRLGRKEREVKKRKKREMIIG